MNRQRWALVTGAAGFVGRHMTAALRERGWSVAAIDNRMCPIPGLLHVDARDVFSGRAPDGLPQYYDLVVHCAYHVGGRRAIDGVPSLLAANLELDAQLFAWALRTGQGRVLYYSSSAAYPVHLQTVDLQIRMTEAMIDVSHVAEPDARYGWAKLTGERLAYAASLQGLPVHVVRPFSGYGGDQDTVYPFPAILARVLAGDMSVWGPPGQVRDWIHIDDVVGASLAIVDADYRTPVNICTGRGIEFGELAMTMAKIAGADCRKLAVRYLRDQPTGVMYRVGSPDRMLTIYHPEISIEDGIVMALGGK